MIKSVKKAVKIEGIISVPGDKSISHRAMLLNSITGGPAKVSNFCQGDDRTAMLNCLTGLGVNIKQVKKADALNTDDCFLIKGRGLTGLSKPTRLLNAGNSGTTLRLISGLLATQTFESIISGDKSLRSRPMDRIIAPLTQMGAGIGFTGQNGFAPLVIRGGKLSGINYKMPVASAQVKSCILIAGLNASGETIITQPQISRDHTERMMRAMGANISIDGLSVTIKPTKLSPIDVHVPGDLSSAAFWMILGVCHSNASIKIKQAGLNPSRTGVIDVLQMMGAKIKISNVKEGAGEPYGDIEIQSSSLKNTVIQGELIPRVIDEIPILALAGCFATGEMLIQNADELRLKESDRISATVDGLTKLGANITETKDGLVIRGNQELNGSEVNSFGDHRIAMTMGIAGALSNGVTTITGAEANMISYPGFWTQLSELTGDFAGVDSGIYS